MSNIAFIINPFSANRNYQSFVNLLTRKVENPRYYISESLEGTERFIRENFDSTDIFVAVGGDGTISSVASHIINTDKTLAIFPLGSGNGFSNETNFNKNIDGLLSKIKKHETRKIDTFTVNGRVSINVSGTGFDSKVVKNFEKTDRGFSNYIKVSISTFFRFSPVQVNFKKEQYRKYDGEYLMVNIANTRQFGNNAYIAPHASTVDGLAEVVLVKKFPLSHGAIFALRMFTKKLKQNRYVTFLSVPEIEFSVSTKDWHIDGEYREIQSPVCVKVLPKSLKILK